MDRTDPRMFQSRSVRVRAAKQEKFEVMFRGRRWRICTELDGPVEGGKCTAGEVKLAAPAVFQTPFGNKGRHGYIIQEVDASGRDMSTRPVVFGIQVLREATEKYGSVINLPPPRPRGRPRTKQAEIVHIGDGDIGTSGEAGPTG